jgi:hypothetical protein
LLEAPLDACTAAAAAAAEDAVQQPLTSNSMAVAAPAAAAAAAAHSSSLTANVTAAAGQGSAAAAATTTAATATAETVEPLATQVLVHRNFFVVQFLMQSMPAGCSYMPLKHLGKFGVLVQRSCKHVVLLFVNASESKPRTLAVDARPWLGSIAAAAADDSHEIKAGVTGRSSPTAQPAAAAATGGSQHVVRVTLLDLNALQSVQYNAAAGLSADVFSSSVHEQHVASNGWPVTVEVPAASLCRVEVMA